MTIAELLAKIKAEIERRIVYAIGFRDNVEQEERASFFNGEAVALKNLLPFLSTLESEKPMNQEGLEKELDKFIASGKSVTVEDCGTYKVSYHDFKKVASHFAEWGYLRAVEKYNEIEYNRQRAEEEMPLPEDTVLFNKGIAEGKRLMMEEAVEGEVKSPVLGPPMICCIAKGCKDGDKVRVIILKKED